MDIALLFASNRSEVFSGKKDGSIVVSLVSLMLYRVLCIFKFIERFHRCYHKGQCNCRWEVICVLVLNRVSWYSCRIKKLANLEAM